jgi:Zn-dependent protease
MLSAETVQQLVLVLVPLILSLTVHEFAHAATARWLGDDTASLAGRFTLNPASHIDPMGSIILPAVLVLSGSGFWFGWARPVPFNANRFTRKLRMKHGILLTAAAGPLSNLLLAALCAVAYGQLSDNEAAAALLNTSVQINVLLCVFNFLPVPPLDGSKVAWGLLPDRTIERLRFFEEQTWIAPTAFLAIFLFGGPLIGPPIRAISDFLFTALAT